MHLPQLISDLALVLIVAGITTLLFKKIKQPLVLGYIVAGFLTGPYFDLIPAVADLESINTWSEIGIIFLMFALGLEFNLHKLASVGGTAIITATVEVAGMLGLGFLLGQAMGWSTMNSVFLGGILSMSSTTIIIKAFEELKLKGRKFTELVFGTLIIEDIAGIFMMIILSTIAVSSGISGGALAGQLALMILFLALWLLLGIYIIPSFLKKVKNLMNDETLLVVAVGMCLGMVLLAIKLGFSSALGAFLAGSILAGTIHAERIEHLTKPVKDLFGAVFFISVGMMVDPAVLQAYLVPILIVTLATLVGKLIFSTLGVLLSGQNLNTALHCGFSLAQIGEFAFIITSLGFSLGVTSDFLYPVIVSVSVITTFTTPFFIRLAGPCHSFLSNRLPERLLNKLNRYTSAEQSEKEQDKDWQIYIKTFFSRTVIYVVIMAGLIYIGLNALLPFAATHLPLFWARLLSTLVILLLMAVFLRPLLHYRDRYFTRLWLKSRSNRPPLLALEIARLVLAVLLITLPVQRIYHFPAWILLLGALLLSLLIYRSDWLVGSYLQVEARFLCNFNERHLSGRAGAAPDHQWLDEHLFVCHFRCAEQAPYLEKSLIDLRWGGLYGVNVIKIVRGKRHINIPAGTEKLKEGDELYLLGSKLRFDNLRTALDLPLCGDPETYPTLHEFIGQQDCEEEDQLLCYAVTVQKGMDLIGSSIKDARIKDRWSCFVVGLERDLYPLINPSPNMLIKAQDLIWVLGSQKMAAKLARADLLATEDEDEIENSAEAVPQPEASRSV